MTIVHELQITEPPTDVAPPAAVVAGCHGGAGTSTTARLLAPAVDAGISLHTDPIAPLLLVTRGTPPGTHAAALALEELRSTGRDVAALVVVGDGPWPEPRLVTLRLHQLRGLVPQLVRLPYIARWRYLDDPLSRALPRRIRRPLQQIITAVQDPSRR